MNLAIISGLLLIVAMATATPSNHSLNFGKKYVQADEATDKTAVESEKAARAANANEGEDDPKGEDEIWTDFWMTLKAPWVNLWTALTALKVAKPNPEPKPKPLRKLTPTGTIGASSNFNNRNNQDNAFTMDKAPKWCSGSRQWPALIWMRFEEPHRLGKISFESQYEMSRIILEVIGSPDCDENNWTTLLTVDYPSFMPFGAKTYLIPSNYPVIESTFPCLGLRFSERVKRSTRPQGPGLDYMCINKIQMWEYP